MAPPSRGCLEVPLKDEAPSPLTNPLKCTPPLALPLSLPCSEPQSLAACLGWGAESLPPVKLLAGTSVLLVTGGGTRGTDLGLWEAKHSFPSFFQP